MRITQPDNTADNIVYESIRELAGISATNAEIDGSVLFRAAEDVIIGALPDAEDRNYAGREQVLTALGFCASANFLKGGGSLTQSSTTLSGDIKSRSQTIDDITVREEYAVGTQVSSSSRSNVDDRIDFFEEECAKIITALGGTLETTGEFGDFCVFLA